MRIDVPRVAERFGATILYNLLNVLELDSGLISADEMARETAAIRRISAEALHDIEQQMAIVVPVRNERIRLIEGVLAGIPHHCLIIVVSNSPREPVDRFHMECRAIETMNAFTGKNILIVHQKDPILSKAIAEAGYPELIGDDGFIRDGKAEGMMVATLLARLANRQYVGFIDSDNYFPGAVLEYVKEYGAGFLLSKSRYSMVRISWSSKPKVLDNSLFFAKYGRASVRTNEHLNRLISYYTGFGTEVIKTGNAGEHALTMDLAMRMNYAAGFAIEPYHFIDLWEQFGGITESQYPEVMKEQVEIYQIESRNPHLHEEKGDEHVDEMIYAAMQVIYHSTVCPPELKASLKNEMVQLGYIQPGEEPARTTYYPSLNRIDLAKLYAALQHEPYGMLLQPLSTTNPSGDGLPPDASLPPLPADFNAAATSTSVPSTSAPSGAVPSVPFVDPEAASQPSPADAPSPSTSAA